MKFGNYGIKAQEATRLTVKQIESVRQTVNRQLSRKGKLDNYFSSYSCNVGLPRTVLGKGKGAADFGVRLLAGMILRIGRKCIRVEAKIALKGLLKITY